MGKMKNIQMKILMLDPTPFFSERGRHIRILNNYLDLKRKGHDMTLIGRIKQNI